jgi:nucleotide-binding universal stress UspA family protein
MKLLVTDDGSPASASVFRSAERLARRLTAEIVLLRVDDPRGKDEHRGAAYFKELEAVWQRELDEIAAGMACPAQAEVRRLIDHVWVADAIVDAAVGMRADLIVMATRGEHELRHAFIGSTALGVLARSPIPLVLVRSVLEVPAAQRASSEGPPRLLVTYDGSPSSRAALEPAGEIARAAGGEIVLAWIHQPIHLEIALEPDPTKRAREIARIESTMASELESMGASLPCPSRVIVRPLTNERWSVVDEIRAVAAEVDADLICMATRGHSGFRHLLFGSTALETLGRSERPVMLVPVEPPVDTARAD